ncbi:MAG: radical SAM protein [Pseudomonadota bacterium]
MPNIILTGLKAGLRQPYLAYCRRRQRLPRPHFLDLAVTWRCNARCIMCDTWRSGELNPEGVAGELSVEQWRAILERDAAFLRDVRKVGLTGGEPFLRPDLVELVRLWHARLPGAAMSLVSNGLLTGRILKALEDIRAFFPDLIFSVSLDGLGPVHDQVRGVPGAFDKALATIRGARELGFTVTSGLTVSHLNYDQIEPVSSMLAELGVDFSCNLQEQGSNFHRPQAAPDLEPDQALKVRQALTGFGHHYYMDNLRQQMEGTPRTLPCYAGYASYFLTPDGQVTMCNLVGTSLGGLAQTPFPELAGSPQAWRLRRQLASCTCWSQCEVKNSAASAPWHVARWLIKNPQRGKVLGHYARRLRSLAR